MTDIDSELAQYRQEYGEFKAFNVPGFGRVVLAVGPKTQPEYHRFMSALLDKGADKGLAFERLALSGVVFPAVDDVRALFKRKPALAGKFAEAVRELCDLEVEELGKD